MISAKRRTCLASLASAGSSRTSGVDAARLLKAAESDWARRIIDLNETGQMNHRTKSACVELRTPLVT